MIEGMLLITHNNRVWSASECSRAYLEERYARPGRLSNLPPFASLPPAQTRFAYRGGVSFVEFSIASGHLKMKMARSIKCDYKIQHAALVGNKLVLCFEDFLYVLPSLDASLEGIELAGAEAGRIDDDWLAGLHTVHAVDENTCVVSASGPDAVLWVDLEKGEVVRRWRLPEEVYGKNYELEPGMSVRDHYIYNDIQLGHLNSAFPNGPDRCFVSVLGQGDLAEVGADGSYRLLARGFVGCHGARALPNGWLYFADSCSGSVFAIDLSGRQTEVLSLNTRWLHDSVHLSDGIFACSVSDCNKLVVVDTTRGVELGRFSMDGHDQNLQFLNCWITQ